MIFDFSKSVHNSSCHRRFPRIGNRVLLAIHDPELSLRVAGCQQRPERWRTEVLDFCTRSHKSSSFTRRKSRTSNNPVPVLRSPSKYGWMSCSLNESNLTRLRHKLQPCLLHTASFKEFGSLVCLWHDVKLRKTQLEVRSLKVTWMRDLWGHRVIVFWKCVKLLAEQLLQIWRRNAPPFFRYLRKAWGEWITTNPAVRGLNVRWTLG